MTDERRKNWWTAAELSCLFAYLKQLEPDERPNPKDIVDLLYSEGFERTEKQVQRKIERTRYDSKRDSKDILVYLQDMISNYQDREEKMQEEGEVVVKTPVTSPKPKPPTPKPREKEPEALIKSPNGKNKWELWELELLQQCLADGHESLDEIARVITSKDKTAIRTKVKNNRVKAKGMDITHAELVKIQIGRMERGSGAPQELMSPNAGPRKSHRSAGKNDEESEEEDEDEDDEEDAEEDQDDDVEMSSEEIKVMPNRRGRKRKIENIETNTNNNNNNDDDGRGSTKRQKVTNIPTATNGNGPMSIEIDNTEVKLLFEQMATNFKTNFSNLRTYINSKFELMQAKIETVEHKIDVLTREVRASRDSNTSVPSSPTKMFTTESFDLNMTRRASPGDQGKQIAYYNFL